MKPAKPAIHPVAVPPLAKAPDQDTDRICDLVPTSPRLSAKHRISIPHVHVRLLVHTACYTISIRAPLSCLGISPEAPTATVQWTHPTQVSSGSGDGAGEVWLNL
jgi:hypothetical protein